MRKFQEKYPESEFCVIGDRIKSEITAGIQAGFHTIWIRKGNFAHEAPLTDSEKPDFTIQDLSEIPEILPQITNLGI